MTHTQSYSGALQFSFHFDDVMRVNNVRNAWKIAHPDSAANRSFYDSSLWEARKLDADESVKTIIRDGINYTSVVCVLVGSTTWNRRWVKYEIARSVIDGKGLLVVHLNSLNHHQRRTPDPLGYNPVTLMGIALGADDNPFLCEWVSDTNGAWKWAWYHDYTRPVPIPKYMPRPVKGHPLALSTYTREYDFARQNGHTNVGGWVDLAATDAGR